MERLLIVGLDRAEYAELRERLTCPSVATETLPRIRIDRGQLLVERPVAIGQFLPVSHVVYHGIFEDDFDFLTALALWRGPCLPDAVGMMDCRLRLPCLARALRVTRFGGTRRGYADGGTVVNAPPDHEIVAKWGNWHCGENKERVRGSWTCDVPTLFEHFIAGEAVRIMRIGDRTWQIRLSGDDWRKSIHPHDAGFMDIDPELADDAAALQRHFNLELVGIDYMISRDGSRHMLEVNHIPNVTRFPEIRAAYLDFATAWVESQMAAAG